MRAAITLSVCCLLAGNAAAQEKIPSIDDLATLNSGALSEALQALRESDGGMAALQELEVAASLRADTRRAGGQPPLSAGCLRADEFELDSQLRIARHVDSNAEFQETLHQYREITRRLDAELREARVTNQWRKFFPSIGRWQREWRQARDPRTRELMRRTLGGQAIRAALTTTQGRRINTKDGSDITLDAYREYVFNLMCAEDEVNLRWFKQQIAEVGWFGVRRFGPAADNAALLLVQHADADPDFQASVAQSLEPRLAAGDTDPENYAYLVDRIAVRARRPQRFGTQMECVGGEWVVPQVESPETLDARRKQMNLIAFDVQMARSEGQCGGQ